MLRLKEYLLLFLLAVLLALPAWSTLQAATRPMQQASGATCLFFTETGNGKGGFLVSDEDNIRFASAFQHWGLGKIGYPISQRYIKDGFVMQAFQKGIMQWRPESNTVSLVNILDELHKAGFDERLLTIRQTPYPLPAGWDGDISFEEVVQKRQALLDARPTLRGAYFSSDDPLTFYGLPTSQVEDMGNHYVIRLQRGVLQEWKEDMAWAKAGQVTIANGGDIVKELGFLPSEALLPLASSPCAAVFSPTTQPPPREEPQANVCTAEMALVEISHTLGEDVELLLEGPEISAAFISRNETERHCMMPGSYNFRAFARVSGQEKGNTTVTTGCQCLRLYWAPTQQPACTCSNNPADYKPLPSGIRITP